jgi:hypothetical protein
MFGEKSGREYRISVCSIRYGRTVQARRCIADLVPLLGERCQGESAPAVNTGSIPLKVVVEGWAAIGKADLEGRTQKVRHIIAAHKACRVPNAAGVDVVGDQKQPGIFEPSGRQDVDMCVDEEFAPRLSRGPDVVDGSSGVLDLNVQSVPAHQDPQERGPAELGRITLRKIRGRAPALKT